MVDSNTYINNAYWIKYKQTLTFGTEPINLTFSEVHSDSRCPSNVICVWQGEAILSFKIFKLGTYERKFNINIEGYVGRVDTNAQKFVDTLGYRFTLMQLDPYPRTDTVRQLSDYIALIKIHRLE